MENNDCLKELERHKKLLSATLLLNSSLEPSYIHNKTIEAITEIVSAEVGSLLLYDEEKDELFFDVALGDKGEIIKKIRLKIGEGIAGSVAQSRKSLIVNDVNKDPRFFRKADEQSGFVTRSILCSPLIYKQKLLGVIQAINKKGNDIFTDEDLNLFESFANIVAIALENANLYNKLKETFFQTSFALAEAVEKRDPYTGGHVKRVTEYCLAIGEELGLDKETMEKIELSAILHDIGKIGIDDYILRKPSPLEAGEIEVMKSHPQIGLEILNKVRHLSDIVVGTFSHHEKYDGTGYPKGLKGDEIPLIGRIIAVCDTYDAMTSNRPYRKGLDDIIAIEEIKKQRGKQFDPLIVDAFIRAFERGKIISQNKRELNHEN
ncbi:MAG: HD domain-containing protein [Proteobacteria bacterium]|nr:HD domain-containing protein [Pseudomonadota bacterium]